MKVHSSIISSVIIFLFGISFYGMLLNTECDSNQGCDRLESLKTIMLIISIISICAILCIFVNGFYNSKEDIHTISKTPLRNFSSVGVIEN